MQSQGTLVFQNNYQLKKPVIPKFKILAHMNWHRKICPESLKRKQKEEWQNVPYSLEISLYGGIYGMTTWPGEPETQLITRII